MKFLTGLSVLVTLIASQGFGIESTAAYNNNNTIMMQRDRIDALLGYALRIPGKVETIYHLSPAATTPEKGSAFVIRVSYAGVNDSPVLRVLCVSLEKQIAGVPVRILPSCLDLAKPTAEEVLNVIKNMDGVKAAELREGVLSIQARTPQDGEVLSMILQKTIEVSDAVDGSGAVLQKIILDLK